MYMNSITCVIEDTLLGSSKDAETYRLVYSYRLLDYQSVRDAHPNCNPSACPPLCVHATVKRHGIHTCTCT